jgi:two-component system phosphate regulon sensor histidine kinase PhoR
MEWLGLSLFLAGAFSALAVCGWVAHRRQRAVEELERSLEALAERGRVPSIPTVRVSGALGRSIRRFYEIVPRLEAQMADLEREHDQLRAVLSGMAEAVIAVDARGRLLFANPSATRLFGLPAKGVGRTLPELIRHVPLQQMVDVALSQGTSYRQEMVVPSRDSGPTSPTSGSSRVLELRGGPLPGTSAPGALLVFHDVTELRRLERMRQDFVANASHELKTPLAAIKAYTETLLDWGLTDPEVNVRFLEQIEEQAERLNQLVLDLLTLARLESGDEVFDHRPQPIAPLVAGIVKGHQARAEAKGLTFQADLSGLDESHQIRADEEAIRQVLDNLIDNAIKYTPEGGKVSLLGRVAGNQIILEVADTGMGIPSDDLPRIFERFYRVDKARSRALGGTGLGLSIVKHLVQSLEGRVSVTSRLGSGSVFTVTLPLHGGGSVRS